MVDKNIIVKTFGSEIEAEMARDYLQDAGIEATVNPADLSPAYPNLSYSSGVGLLVSESDADSARTLLEEMTPPGETEEPNLVVSSVGSAFIGGGSVLVAIGLLTIALPVRTYIGVVIAVIGLLLAIYGVLRRGRDEFAGGAEVVQSPE